MAEGLKAVEAELNKLGLSGVSAQERRSSVVLEGQVDSWQQYIDAGYAAAGKGYKGVVNDIQTKGVAPRAMYAPPEGAQDLDGQDFDVVIVGGGVSGCAIAREMMKWKLTVAILEKEEDVAKQTSSRNNGMIHSGLGAGAGSKKLEYNVRGNRMYARVAQELDLDLLRCGLLVLMEKGIYKLAYPFVRYKMLKAGIDGIELLGAAAAARRVPRITDRQRGALLLPSTAVVAPYKVTVAYAENAVQNGAKIFLNTVVRDFEMAEGKIAAVKTNRGKVRAKAVINAAGVWSDHVAGLAGDRFFTIHGRKGTIAILDKNSGRLLTTSLSMPEVGKKSYTKGGGLNPTVEGNILAGPTAVEVPHREDWSTSPDEIEFILQRHLTLHKGVKREDIITYFSGVRACTFEEDFVIEVSDYVSNLVHVAGIQSPGLTSVPAIAEDVALLAISILQKAMVVKPNNRFAAWRQRDTELSRLSLEERSRVIESNPSYGRIICRCEAISAGEVVGAINGSVPAITLDAIKRRTRAGMGRCQGGFCTPALIHIVCAETGAEPTAVAKGRPGSELLSGLTKSEGGAEKEILEYAGV